MAENAKGALFKNNEKKGSQPDWTGNIELNKEILQELLKEAEKGPYKARLAGWLKEGRNGKFLSLALNAPFDKNKKATGRSLADDGDPF